MESVTLPKPTQRIRGPWVEIDLRVLADNIRVMQGALQAGTEVMFIVKANAYGHGLEAVAVRAAAAGVKWFGVAYVQEALRVRAVVPEARILVMGVVDPADVEALLQHRIVPIVVSEGHGRALAGAAGAAGAALPVHLKIDTGMGRLGVPWENAASTLRRLGREPGLELSGLCSHFATVEPEDPASALLQYQRFQAAAEAGPSHLFKHISSSRAFLYHPEWDFDAVRVGIALYGYGAGEADMRVETRPLLQWKSTVIQVKPVPAHAPVGYYGTYVTPAPTNLAVVAAGYADGYLRTLSNRARVLIRGRRYRVVGRVSMNWLTIDVGADTDVVEGDEVVLIGAQGDQAIWANELARLCRTIAYEILVGINSSIERQYLT